MNEALNCTQAQHLRNFVEEHKSAAKPKPTVSMREIEAARQEYVRAALAMDDAEPDFIESAVFQLNCARSRYDALIKMSKDPSVTVIIDFPTSKRVPIQGQKRPGPELLMDVNGVIAMIAAIVLGIAAFIAQLGFRLEWF